MSFTANFGIRMVVCVLHMVVHVALVLHVALAV